MGAWLVPAVQGASSLIGNIFTNSANKRESELSYQRQLELMKYQNEYNSPVMQMERLRKAGLNPHLVYGNGNVTGNLTGDMPKYNATEKNYDFAQNGLPNALASYQQIQLSKAQQDNVEADSIYTKAKTATEGIKALSEGWKLEKDRKFEPYQFELLKKNVDQSLVDISNSLKLGEIRDSELKTKEVQREAIKAQIAKLGVDTKIQQKIYDRIIYNKIYPGDPQVAKLAERVLQILGIDDETLKKRRKSQSWSDKGFHKGQYPDSPDELEYYRGR